MMLGVPGYDPRIIEASGIKSVSADEITAALNEYANRYNQVFTNITQRKYFNAYVRGLLILFSS